MRHHARTGISPRPGNEPVVELFHASIYHRKHCEVPGLNYNLIKGGYDLADPVTVLSLPGHTPGYQALKVNLPKNGPW